MPITYKDILKIDTLIGLFFHFRKNYGNESEMSSFISKVTKL